MFAENLRKQLSELAGRSAKKYNFLFGKSRGGVIIFKQGQGKNIHGNFLNSSYDNILGKENWRIRLEKPHPSFHDRKQQIKELDSCNSPDALLMNVFCHPRIDNMTISRKFLMKNCFPKAARII